MGGNATKDAMANEPQERKSLNPPKPHGVQVVMPCFRWIIRKSRILELQSSEMKGKESADFEPA